jgi:hypothetical protein
MFKESKVLKLVSKFVISGLLLSLMALVPIPMANAHNDVYSTNISANVGTTNGSLIVATRVANVAIIHPSTGVASSHENARSAGLVLKSTTSGTAQTATVRSGGVLSLYAKVSTSSALTADGGSFTKSTVSADGDAVDSTTPAIGVVFPLTLAQAGTATPIAALWQAPTTTGSYTITLRSSTDSSQISGATSGSNGTAVADITVTVTDSQDVAGGSNAQLMLAAPDVELYVAVSGSTTGASIVSSATDVGSAHVNARSLGLLSKDSTARTAQTATILAGGSLSLYAVVATDVAFNASGGSFSGAVDNLDTVAYNQTLRSVFIDVSAGANLSTTIGSATTTSVAVRWTAPTTPGTYTVSMDRSAATTQLASDDFSGTLTGQITVTVVATSAGGSYSAANSLCNTALTHRVATGIDTTSAITNTQTGYVVFDLDDVYDAALDAGALVVSATNGALISLASNGSTAAAGTASTVVSTRIPSDQVVQVTQGTANAPQSTTVTITFNGTTVCTKALNIRGEIAKLEIGNIGTGDLNSSNTITAGATTWMAGQIGATDRAGLFTVIARDSANNTVVTNAGGTFSADSATLTTTVQALTVTTTATTVSSTSDTFAGYGFGTWTCGATAGSSSVKLKWTNSGSGTVVTSDAFTARCADDPYTYTASWDKASYVAGEIATLTVQFLDSKGNKANNVGAPGTVTISAPMMTAVSSTSSASNLAAKNDGTRTYTFTVGISGGSTTTGTYVSIIEYATLAAGTKQTPSYKISSGTDDVAFAEVLKSIVALIASINKQIQALQKLILKK